jgi:L-rhamnose isomerase/sugar isomerase
MGFELADEHIAAENLGPFELLQDDYDHLGLQLARRNIDIEALTTRAAAFRVAVPSWGVGTGGTRFARFPGPGEPRNVFEKLEDCEVVFKLVRSTPGISLHIPWDRPESAAVLRTFAESRGLFIDSMNSNTFQDQPGQPLSYKHGSLTHVDAAVRRQAIDHNIECLQIGASLGARSHTVWIGDGGNFPGQLHFRRSLDRYLESLRAIYEKLPTGWRLFLEHKPYEPAFYSTVLADWGTSYYCATALGERAFSLVDLGHHVPNTNIEQVVARLIQLARLGGFHFNDSKFGDDDLDAGSVKPFQLFLVFNELVDAELERLAGFDPAYMLDQSHNVTDPIESLMTSTVELVRAYVQAHLVDREELSAHQLANDPMMALQTLKRAFNTDVTPILAMARYRAGGAVDPVALYRASGYRQRVEQMRPVSARTSAGIV